MKLLPRRPNRETIVPEGQASFSCRRFRLKAFPFEWHYHPEMELTLILRGQGLRFIGDSIEPYSVGDLVLIGPDLPHTWHSADEDGPVESVVVHFPRGLFGETVERMPEYRPIRQLLEAAGRALHITGDARDHVGRLMSQAAAVPPASLARLMALLQSLEVLAGQTEGIIPLTTSNRLAGLDTEANRKLQRVIERIHSTVAADGTLAQADMAEFAHMSPAAFSRFFHRRMGRPYARYVNEWRVGLACRRLVETDDDITDIAFGCGFGNLSNFNRRFKQIKSMTPREFRNLGSLV
jgi:AraC-like DNA-binding protein/quercetin dioxygenase-like cupin family protein